MTGNSITVKTVLLLFLVLGSSLCIADEVRPAYLELTELKDGTFSVYWKVPAMNESEQLDIDVLFDNSVELLEDPVAGYMRGAHVQRWLIHKPGGLSGTVINMDGLEGTSTEVIVQIENLDGSSQVHRITPDATEYMVRERSTPAQIISAYTLLGIEHILSGFDHLLFVYGLLLLVTGLRKLVLTITAFTMAHSITLSLATLGVIAVPVPPVEAIIALSIVFVATEILNVGRGLPGITQKYPWSIAFIFGLLHGMGFAAALGEIGLPQTAVPAALLFFNVGVELGQLVFVAAFIVLTRSLQNVLSRLPDWSYQVPPYAIGSLASFWFIERVAGF